MEHLRTEQGRAIFIPGLNEALKSVSELQTKCDTALRSVNELQVKYQKLLDDAHKLEKICEPGGAKQHIWDVSEMGFDTITLKAQQEYTEGKERLAIDEKTVTITKEKKQQECLDSKLKTQCEMISELAKRLHSIEATVNQMKAEQKESQLSDLSCGVDDLHLTN